MGGLKGIYNNKDLFHHSAKMQSHLIKSHIHAWDARMHNVRQRLSCDARAWKCHILDILKGLDFGRVTMSDTNQAQESSRADEDRG